MAVEIKQVKKWSAAFFKGVKAGDRLLKINGNEINDFLDYSFYLKDEEIKVEYEHKGRIKSFKLKSVTEEDIGLIFGSYLMDKEKRCHNKCIFCFIDQNPEGMRESIYFKDDDSRLSYLFGNYITLTNLTGRDVDRIIKMHISPVNVSVHTMNKELRVKMMKNKNAGACLDYLKCFADAGIKLNAQLVLCPGINDGVELRYSLEKLSEFYPAIESIAAVPVGVTKHREGLYSMPEYTKETAAEVIDIIDEFGEKFKKDFGTRLIYAADEFYLKAELEIPGGEYYEGYPQLENGVGSWRNLADDFTDAFNNRIALGKKTTPVSLITGEAAYSLIKTLATEIKKVYTDIDISVHKIKNNFFGKSITVAGLITGGDIIKQMKNEKYYKKVIIPSVMLRSEGDLFLDGISLEELKRELSADIYVTDGSAEDLISLILYN